jgi:redox-sensitive bicupin YhaK (pirin superfamily)
VITGEVTINGQPATAGDGLALAAGTISVVAQENAHLLAVVMV